MARAAGRNSLARPGSTRTTMDPSGAVAAVERLPMSARLASMGALRNAPSLTRRRVGEQRELRIARMLAGRPLELQHLARPGHRSGRRIVHEAAVGEVEAAVQYAGAAVEALLGPVAVVREARFEQGQPLAGVRAHPAVAERAQAPLVAVRTVEVLVERVEAVQEAPVARGAEARDQAPLVPLREPEPARVRGRARERARARRGAQEEAEAPAELPGVHEVAVAARA